MAKKYYGVERLNEEISKIENKGFTPPTRLYRNQEGLTAIVIGNELKNAGYIRTYEEALQYIQRKDENASYSREQYEEDLERLQDRLKGERTYLGVSRRNRTRLLKTLEDAGIDGKNLTTKKMYEAVKEAGERVRDEKAKSPQFYEYLRDILES